jgi:RND family efflux transporter MFP subunit
MMASADMNIAPVPGKPRRWPWIVGGIVVVAAATAYWWPVASKKPEAQAARKGPGAVAVVTAKAEARDVPVKLRANGTVTALQSVDLRSQVTSTVREMHIREGQTVGKGDLLFTLDARTEEANLKKAQAQVEKDKADLATAMRNLARQRELFEQKFISQSALDTAQNQVDTLNGQLAVDSAALEAARVARAFTEIRAPFAGRTGTISVRPGSLVQPGATSPPLVTVTVVDPVAVSFTLPEKELPTLQQALRAGGVGVTATSPSGGEPFKGKITFVDNAVDTATGTIRVKAEFANPRAQLWPGMYVNVELSPRTIANATVVPAQAVQTGPEQRFVYVVEAENKVAARTVKLAHVDDGMAVVEGVAPGARVVVEGAQNLRPGSVVAEAGGPSDAPKTGRGEGAKKGKRSS